MGLSRRGEVVNLWSRGLGGGIIIHEHINVYCVQDTEKVRSQIPTNAIQNLELKSILLALGWIAGLEFLHQASRPMIFYVVECICPTIYDWSTSLLRNMKQDLTYYKMGRVRKFGYGSILSALFFKRPPGLSPRVDVSQMDFEIRLSDAGKISCRD